MAKKISLSTSNNPLFAGPSLSQRDNKIPYRQIPISEIERDSNQPRVEFDPEKLEELSRSIKKYGVLSPILVRKKNDKYMIISGERRFRASKLANLQQIPAIIDSEEDASGERTLAIQIIENMQRADLSPLEKAYAISALKETHNFSVRQVADKLAISKSSVQRYIDILDLPDDLINALRQGASESKVLMLSKIKNEKERAELLKDLGNISRDILSSKVKKANPKPEKRIDPEDRRLVEEMQRALGLKVVLKRTNNDTGAGKLTVDLNSESDLQAVFRKLVQ